MVDDILPVSECGFKVVDLNSYLNTKTNLKKLQFGADKCVHMHIGKQTPYCPDLYCDKLELKKSDETRLDIRNLQDVLGKEHPMKNSDEQKYLGYLINSNGSNKSNIAAKRGKGIGCVKQILSILEDITFGHHKYRIAVLLRNSLLINSILYNSEVWYSLTISDIEQLEQVDEMVLRGALSVPIQLLVLTFM